MILQISLNIRFEKGANLFFDTTLIKLLLLLIFSANIYLSVLFSNIHHL
jgi:hypothetical protein